MEYNTLREDIRTILYEQRKIHPVNQIEYIVCSAINKTTYHANNVYLYIPGGYESVEVYHMNVDLLVSLYYTMLDDTWKHFFMKIIVFEIFNGDFKKIKYFFLEFLVKTYQVDLIFVHWSHFNESESLKKLGSLICFEPQYFLPENLNRIQEIIEKDPEAKIGISDRAKEKKKILDLLMSMKYESLFQKLTERENPEINFDVKRVRKEMENLDFPKELKLLLSEIQSEYSKAKTDKEYNEVIDKVRKFLDQLEGLVSERVSRLLKTPISKGKGPGFGRRRQFLCEQGLIQEDEQKLLDGLYGMASTEGTHSLRSSAEHVRICRNIAVEAALFILKRFREFEAETHSSE